VPWIHPADQVGIIVAALADRRWEGPVNACAPHPATNRELTRALGRALHRPAALPIPGLALRVLYGEMAGVITAGQRAVPEQALSLGYRFSHPELEAALRDALGSG
jgi:NAD dependent epimerase/dehydratase family enzyme